MRTKNESTALQQGAAALQNDIEALRARMKEDVATMKHEYVPCAFFFFWAQGSIMDDG